ITTNKTDFFREPHHFEFIAKQFVPDRVQRAKRSEIPRRLRIWHAGCSTGEEPYTLAMTLGEAFEGQGKWDVRQLASDIDTEVLADAERGIYEEDRIVTVPDRLAQKYFLRGKNEWQGHFKVRPELCEQITFRQINLLDDAWPIRGDVRFD